MIGSRLSICSQVRSQTLVSDVKAEFTQLLRSYTGIILYFSLCFTSCIHLSASAILFMPKQHPVACTSSLPCLHLHSPSIISPGPVHLPPNYFSSWFLIVHSSPQAVNTFSSKSVSCSKPPMFIITLRLHPSTSPSPLLQPCFPCSHLAHLSVPQTH